MNCKREKIIGLAHFACSENFLQTVFTTDVSSVNILYSLWIFLYLWITEMD